MNLTCKLTATLALAASLAGCSTTIALNKIQPSSAQVTLIDKRSIEERIYRRDGVQNPIQYFGDEDFDFPPLSQFSALLGTRLPPGSFTFEAKKFRVIDVFPQRLGAGTAAALTGALGSMGYRAYFFGSTNLTQDNITCLVSGSLQAKEVDASASVPYKISPLSGLIKNDASFKAAVNACLVRLANEVAKSV